MTDKKYRHNFYRLIGVDDIPDALSSVVWMCKASPPPSRKDDSVTKHSELKWAAKIDWSKLPQRHFRDDEEFYELEFQAEMKCSSGVTDLAILHKGRRQATRNVQVEYFDKADV